MRDYGEFRIRIERGPEEGTYRVECSGLGGDGAGAFTLPFTDTELENFVLKVGRTRRGVRKIESPEMQLARKFGGQLFGAIMQGKTGELYRAASSEARATGQGLRITLSLTDVPELGGIPWEYLYDEPNFLSINAWTPVVRYLDLPKPRRALEMELPLRILGVISNPLDAEQLDVELEKAKLENALKPLRDANAVAIDWLEEPTLLALAKKLRPDTYHILHFIGHGGFDDVNGEGALLFEDAAGRGRAVSGDQLAAVLYEKRSLRLVLLNSCEGARNAVKDPFSGVAASLVQREIPAVIGMQFEITDRAAVLFASEFYAMLAEGQPIDSAISEARLAIWADSNDVEWGTPVLFMRVADGRLFNVSHAAALPRPAPQDLPAKAPPVIDEPPLVVSEAPVVEVAPPIIGPPPIANKPPSVVAQPPAALPVTEAVPQAPIAPPYLEPPIESVRPEAVLPKPPEVAPVAEQPAPAPPSAQSKTYRAYGLLESDESVIVAVPFELKVGLWPSPSLGVAGAPLELERPLVASYQLDIQLFADGFDLGPGESWRHRLLVSADDLYPSVAIHLTARELPAPRAIRSITATFSIEGETLGTATRQIVVTTEPTALPTAPSISTATGTNITAPTGEPPADITITIKRGLEPGALLWGVESPLPQVALQTDRAAKSDIGEDPREFATAIIRKLFVQRDQQGVMQLLQGIGKTIRDEIPTDVRAALNAANAAVAPRPVDILLLTEEPYVPWELAWIDEPFDPKAPSYLGAQANIGRWVLDEGATATNPPRHVNATTMAVVWGVYTSASLQRLVAAEEEARLIQDQYHAASIDARPELVYPLLEGSPPSDILHFAVHGRYDPQGPGEGIYLVSGPPIDPLQIRGSDLGKRGPFVFLNACQVGSAQNLLGSYGGIAQAFLQIGASGVVAPLWSIDDAIAQKIALEFYEHALAPVDGADGNGKGERKGPAVADLLRRARGGLVENSAAPSSTYLAYQFYGHPSLRLSWSPAAVTEASPDVQRSPSTRQALPAIDEPPPVVDLAPPVVEPPPPLVEKPPPPVVEEPPPPIVEKPQWPPPLKEQQVEEKPVTGPTTQPRRRVPWRKVAIGGGAVLAVLTVIGLLLRPESTGSIKVSSEGTLQTGRLLLNGSGFAAGETVDIYLDEALALAVDAGADGSFNTELDVGSQRTGTVSAVGRDSQRQVNTNFEVKVATGSASPGASDSASPGASDTAPAPVSPGILFYSDVDQDLGETVGRELYLLDPVTGNIDRLTHNEFDDTFPTWSPDYTQIAFSRGKPGSRDIFVRDLRAEDSERPLVTDSTDDWFPAWSKNGLVAFNRAGPGGADKAGLWVISIDRGEPAREVLRGSFGRAPAWSTDGTRLAFMSLQTGTGLDVAIVQKDGTGFDALLATNAAERNPTWSPNDETIVFVSDDGGDDQEIYKLNVATESTTPPLTVNEVLDGNPVWSPDGKQIAFHRESADGFHIWTMNADGTKQEDLMLNALGENMDPNWR